MLLLGALIGLINVPRLSSGDSLATAPDVPWTSPAMLALHNTGPVQNTPDRDYDCVTLSYRMIDSITKEMHTGCFVQAAFGMLDPAKSVVIFNGTDEAVQIRYGNSGAGLKVLPYSATVARLGGFSSGVGNYMYLYDYFPTNLQDSVELPSLTRYKQLYGNPGTVIRAPSGDPLIVNGNAMAYAPRGQWMVTESPSRALIRMNLATFNILPFASSFYSDGMPYATHSARMAITGNGRYAAVASNEYQEFEVYDLASCVGGGQDALSPKNCPHHDYWPYIKQQVTGTLKFVHSVRFIHDGLIAFDATTSAGRESYLLSPTGSITSLIPYLGMGDSYASGQGAWNYTPSTDTATNKCHLSAKSYPLLLSGDLFSNAGHSVACSGARMHDTTNTWPGYRGQASSNKTAKDHEADGSEATILHDFTPGNLAQQSFVSSYLPGVITVQIGGNDVGFGNMLLRCISPLASIKPPKLNPSDCYSSYEDRLEVAQTIDRQFNTWVRLYKQLQQASPESRIYAISYPQIVSEAGKCRLNTPLSAGDIAFAQYAVTYLNSVIQKAATVADAQYVDISNALVGARLCEGNREVAMNGITAGNDTARVLGQESFHPNAFGHSLIEQAILRATNNLKSPKPTPGSTTTDPPAIAPDDPLLQAPKSGRSIRNIIPDDRAAPDTAQRGGNVTITLDGLNNGLAGNSSYVVAIGNTPIGTMTTDDQGNAQTTLPVPNSTEPGTQPVTITGGGSSGGQTTVTDVVYVDTNPTDYDDDGIPNTNDDCSRIPNSGIDEDDDGTDDACDAEITPPSIITTNPPSTSGTNNTQPGVLQAAASTEEGANSRQLLNQATLTSNRVSFAVRPNNKPNTLHGSSIAPTDSSVTPAAARTPKPPVPRFLWYFWLAALILFLIIAYSCHYRFRTLTKARYGF